ncbi:MAG: FHA domain-containing protein, partial [Planctomycetota bacterium]
QDAEGTYYVKDLGSKNGTIVNGETLKEGGRAELSDGASVFFGPSVRAFFFRPKGLAYYMSIYTRHLKP